MKTYRINRLSRLNRLNQRAQMPQRFNMIYGWILPNGEVIDLPMYEHADYVKNNPGKFNIPANINMSDLMDHEAYIMAFQAGAIRYSYCRKLNLDCKLDALYKLFEVVHKIYRRSGNIGGVYINLRGDDGNTISDINVDKFDELNEYASSKIDKMIKVGGTIKVGWIAPNGEVCEIMDAKAHWNYLLNNPDKFGIKMDVRWMDNGVESLYWQAFENGAIRYHSSADKILNIQCTRDGLKKRVSDIHNLYKKLGCNNGFYISIIKGEDDRIGEDIRVDDIGDLYSYASKNSSVKIYRISRYELGHQFWILSNGVIRDLGGGLHIDYIKDHIREFGIDESLVVGKEFSSIPYYRYAFKSGAIRVVITDREFTIECSRGALRKHIEVLHSLYKKYCNNVRIYLEFNEGNKFVDHVDVRDINDLYNYASNVKIYRISMEMRELEEKPITGDGQVELTHLINLLHEIEYKNKMLQGSNNFIHPKRKANIELRLKQYAWVYFKYIKKFTIECFNMWNNLHPIESGDKWADMVIEIFRDSYGKDEDVIKRIIDDKKLEWNSMEYDISEAPIDRESVREYLQYMASDGDDVENLLITIGIYLESIGEDVDNANLDMIEDDEFIDYYIKNMSVDLYSMFINMNSIKELIKGKIYRDYMITWGGTVEDIKRNIKDSIDRMEGIGENSSISEMTMAISLALNVQHASGTVLIDMGDMAYDQYIIGDVNSKYLDLLSELDVSDWESEFHREFAI